MAQMRLADVLTEDQCWSLLASTDLGRLAVRSGHDIEIFPVNFLVWKRALYFRTAPGGKMIGLTREPRVAFEADGSDAALRWSVAVKGTADRLDRDSEIEESGVSALASDDPGLKWNYVRVSADSISGRRFASAS